MFPLQPKVCLFIQKQSNKENIIKSNNQKKTTSKHQRKTTSIYLCTKQQEKKKMPTLKNLQSNELRGGLDYRHEISNHGLAVIFLQLNTCLLSYSHLFSAQGSWRSSGWVSIIELASFEVWCISLILVR